MLIISTPNYAKIEDSLEITITIRVSRTWIAFHVTVA